MCVCVRMQMSRVLTPMPFKVLLPSGTEEGGRVGGGGGRGREEYSSNTFMSMSQH